MVLTFTVIRCYQRPMVVVRRSVVTCRPDPDYKSTRSWDMFNKSDAGIDYIKARQPCAANEGCFYQRRTFWSLLTADLHLGARYKWFVYWLPGQPRDSEIDCFSSTRLASGDGEESLALCSDWCSKWRCRGNNFLKDKLEDSQFD